LALADSTLPGGVPIKLDGKVIGAVGVSGDTPQVDEASPWLARRRSSNSVQRGYRPRFGFARSPFPLPSAIPVESSRVERRPHGIS